MGIIIHSLGDAFFVAISGVLSVFTMLACLAAIIVLITKAMGKGTELIIEPYRQKQFKTTLQQGTNLKEAFVSGGRVQLLDVDEKKAACIMAIVSDETGIPLNELVFKSIRHLKN